MGLLDIFKNRRRSARARETVTQISAIPADKINECTNRLVKGPGANDHLMSVDGSITPVDFVWGPSAGDIMTITSLSAILLDEGTMTHTVFGSLLAPLTNGIHLLTKIKGVEREIALLVDNSCMVLCFFTGNVGIGGGAGLDGFFNTNDVAAAQRRMGYPITLNGDDGDQIIVRIQDDLTAIDLLRVQANANHIIESI